MKKLLLALSVAAFATSSFGAYKYVDVGGSTSVSRKSLGDITTSGENPTIVLLIIRTQTKKSQQVRGKTIGFL